MAESRPSPLTSAQALNKACEPCRSLKVRCLPATDGPNASCQRCIKFNRPCVYAAPHRKKQRKRTDARVTELEKEILAMRALLDRTHKQIASADFQQSRMSPPTSFTASPTQNSPDASSNTTDQSNLDIVDRGLISIEEAQRLLTVYKTECIPHFPLVAIRPEQTADQLRITHPILFKAIMTTSSASARTDLYTQLCTELLKEYVQRVMINGEKTLELVQAISITSSWYHPTDKWSSLKFYELITLASSMAVDLGLGDRETIVTIRDPLESLERKRALIACFTHSSAVAFGFRRPTTLPFTTYMGEILDELDTSLLAQTSDRSLNASARLFKMANEITATFALTDAGREGQVSELEFQHNIVLFDQRLQSWKDHYRLEHTSPELLYHYHHIMIALHEIPLHQIYPPTWFKLPYYLVFPTKRSVTFSATANQALIVACASAHAVIEIFLSRPLNVLRAAPGSFYGCLAFSLMILTSISLIPDVTTTQPGATSPYEYYRDMTQIVPLLDAVGARMVITAGRMEYRIASLFSVSLSRLRKWLAWVGALKAAAKDPGQYAAFSILAGPDDHPCLGEGGAEESPGAPSSYADGVEGSDGFTPALPLDGAGMWQAADAGLGMEVPPMTTREAMDWSGVQGFGRMEGLGLQADVDFDWLGELEQDYSSILDPAAWEPDVGFINLATQ